jgi:hypothetical protein
MHMARASNERGEDRLELALRHLACPYAAALPAAVAAAAAASELKRHGPPLYLELGEGVPNLSQDPLEARMPV